MEENAKSQDGGDKMLLISILKLEHALLYFFNLKVGGKYIVLYKEHILPFRFIIYVLYSFTHTFSGFYVYRVALHSSCGMCESFI